VSIEKITSKFSDKSYWDSKIKYFDINKALGMHIGYYEKGINKNTDAVCNMDYLVGRLLDLGKSDDEKKIFDVGCGIGGTCIHLAKIYPKNIFYGINITPDEVVLAKLFAMEHRVTKNTDFCISHYDFMPFISDYFDGIIALESLAYSKDMERFIFEAKRVLKPGKKLVIVDGFLTSALLNPFMQRVYNIYNNKRKAMFYLENDWRRKYLYSEWDKLPDSKSIETLCIYLEKQGFENIVIRNLSKNVRLSSFRYSSIAESPLPIFNSSKKIKSETYEKVKTCSSDSYISYLFAKTCLGLKGKIGYYAITAEKK